MKRNALAWLTVASAVLVANAEPLPGLEAFDVQTAHSPTMKITADRIAADRNTSALVASGHVAVVSMPARLHSEFLERDTNGVCRTCAGTSITTCTNCLDRLHWEVRGTVEYKEHDHVLLRDAWMYFFRVPVLWVPYLYYPMNGEFGLRVMVGYTGRWGAYLQTKYVYSLFGDHKTGQDGSWLYGNTRFDLRSENGIAVGESLTWSLGNLGQGKFKIYYAWDQDAEDRYGVYTSARDGRNYGNWGSMVPDQRYGIELKHRIEPTERDIVRGNATIFSDTYFRYDFLRRMNMTLYNDFDWYAGNEVAWEHQEQLWALGVSASGPLTKFEGGTARLPEVYFDVAPVRVWQLPVNYESQSRIGYLSRSCAEYGDSDTLLAFSRNPGLWADYETFRFDTYHRLTAPFRAWDSLSVVPRIAYRGTYWNDSGLTSVTGLDEANGTGDKPFRSIVEGGITFAGRGTGWLTESTQHMIEPYFDVLAQEAIYSGLSDGSRPYVFDGLDASSDWADQYAGRSRNLPYSWYGITPGLRNVLRRPDERGVLRTLLDLDVYACVQFNTTTFTEGGDSHKLAEVGDPNYGAMVVPGLRTRWFPSRDTVLSGRVEYESEYNRIAQATLSWQHRLTRRFSYHVSYVGRDHRWWDFSSSPVTDGYYDGFNWAKFGYAEVGFEHELCDAFAWSPYLRWDCQRGELDEVGAWIDVYRTDCIGFRFNVAYENEFARVDGSREEDEWRVGLFIYLRALGPQAGLGIGD